MPHQFGRFIPLNPAGWRRIDVPGERSARQKPQGSKAFAQRYRCAMGLDFRESADSRAQLSTKVSML
jgi:hypothetical protein